MSFKKLHSQLQENLIKEGLENSNELQKVTISKFKQGNDFIAISGEKTGKTTAIVTGVVQRLEKPSNDDAPRAIIYVTDKEKALEMEKLFLRLAKRTELRTVVLHEKRDKIYQRIDLYEGSDIIIGTAKRIQEMYLQNGINLANIKLYILDDADEILKQNVHTPIIRVYESIPKCQTILFTSTETEKTEKLEAEIMKNTEILEFKS